MLEHRVVWTLPESYPIPVLYSNLSADLFVQGMRGAHRPLSRQVRSTTLAGRLKSTRTDTMGTS
jgi:hypothetical protein